MPHHQSPVFRWSAAPTAPRSSRRPLQARCTKAPTSFLGRDRDQREYLIQSQGERLRDQPPVLRLQTLGDVARLAFDNYVGLAEVLGHRFRVRHGKLTDVAFDQMLDAVVAEVADLAFDFASPTSLPFGRDTPERHDCLPHA